MLFNFYTTILINFLIEQYFQDRQCLLIFTDNNNDYNFNYNGTLPTIRISNDSIDYDLIFHYYGCQGIIINTHDPSGTIQKFEHEIYYRKERFNRRRYLILPNFNENYKKIYQLPELKYIMDLLIVIPQVAPILLQKRQLITMNNDYNKISYQFESHKYVGINNHNETVILDKWFANNQSFQFNKNLYPDKLTNQYGRNVHLGTFTYPPYSIINGTPEESYGSEFSVSYYYCKKFNMTPIIIVNDDGLWGDIYPNRTGYGILGNLLYDKTDIGFGALYTWEFCYDYLDLTKPLVRTGITCLVPEPQLAAGWLTPLFSYTLQVWQVIIISYFLGVLILTLSLYLRNDKDDDNSNQNRLLLILNKSMLIIFKQFLTQALTKSEIPKGFINKFIIYLMLMYGLFITNIYNSGFASIMTIPRYENVIHSVDQLVESGLKWGATEEAWIMSLRESNNSKDLKLVKMFFRGSDDELHQRAKQRKYGFSIERLPHENFAIGQYMTEDLVSHFRLMHEDLYWENCVIMTRKNSVLLPSLDAFILRMFEAGLISEWQDAAVVLFMDLKVQNIVKYYNHHLHDDNSEFVKLQWVHVEGAFAILIVGHSIGLLIFILEILLNTNKAKKMINEL